MQAFRLASNIALVALMWSTPAAAQEMSIRAGESVDLHPVYWVRNCQSQLRKIEGVDLLEGPPGVSLSIRSEEVMTSARHSCSSKVPGGIVVATVKDVPARVSGTLTYRVRYDTDEGQRQSTHTRSVTLYP
jgi:hypothetical protein